MLAPLVAALLAVQNPAPLLPLDADVFEDTAYAVAIARPGPDWVFEPARSRGTTTVIFSPRGASLRDQLWGVLALTTASGAIELGRVADQVIAGWSATLGPSYALLTRDTLTIQGFPAVHVVMSGAISGAVLDVEEYIIARDRDLVRLQFRYPRGLPRDSIALGYERALAGLRIGRGVAAAPAAPSPAPAPAPAPVAVVGATPAVVASRPAVDEDFDPPPSEQMWSALSGSTWRTDRVDAQVRLADQAAALAFEVRLELVNDGLTALDAVTLWVPQGASMDSVRVGPAAAERGYRAPLLGVALNDTIPFQGRVALVIYYRRAPLLRGAVAYVRDWLPVAQSAYDSAGQTRAFDAPRVSIRFDLPDGFAGVATGRLVADLESGGRRRQTWSGEGIGSNAPGFTIGALTPATRRAGRLEVRVWSGAAPPPAFVDSVVALAALGWAFGARAFGQVSAPQLDIVLDAPVSFGLPALLLLRAGAALDPAVVLREVARTWFGGAVRGSGAGAAWINEGFPAWAALAARGAATGDSARDRLTGEATMAWRETAINPALSTLAPRDARDLLVLRGKGAAALEAARRAAGESRFREALRTFAAEHRNDGATVADFLALLGPEGEAAIRPYLFGR